MVLVAPEIQGHGWDGLGAHQLAHFTDDGLAIFAPRFHSTAQQAALHLARHLRQLAVAADECAAKVGAARDVAPPDVAPTTPVGRCRNLSQATELLRSPALHVFGQRRAGRAQGADAAQVVTLGLQRGQVHAAFHAVGVERGTGTEPRDAVAGGKTPQHGPVGRVFAAAGATVEQHDGGAARQPGQLGVPHDPAGGAVPVEALTQVVGVGAGPDVVVQALECQQRHQDAAMPVHDGLGQAGGAAGIHNPQRVVKRQPLGFKGISFSIILATSVCPINIFSY